jgi:uncharacterized paraquat-inducible protein A
MNYGMPELPDGHEWKICTKCNLIDHTHFDHLSKCTRCGSTSHLESVSDEVVRMSYFIAYTRRKLGMGGLSVSRSI